MAEEQEPDMLISEEDSRTATVGKKRAFETTTAIASSESSEAEPVNKRQKQTSESQQNHLPSEPVAHVEYISLLDTDDGGSEEYASAESGEISDSESVDNAVGSGPTSKEQGDSTAEVNLEDSDEEYASAEAGSIEDDIPVMQVAADTSTTVPRPAGGDVPTEPSGSSRDNNDILAVTVVKSLGEADRTAIAEGRRISISGIQENATKANVLALFKDFKVESIYMPENQNTKKCLGFASICLSSASDVQKAIATLDRSRIIGRNVSMKLSPSIVFNPNNPISQSTGLSSKEIDELIALLATPKERVSMELSPSIGSNPNNPISKSTGLSGKEIDELIALLPTPRERNELRQWNKWLGKKYVNTVEEAIKRRSLYPVQIWSERRRFRVYDTIIQIPDMIVNNSPIPFPELRFFTFIPLLISANPQQAALLLKTPGMVSMAFKTYVNTLYAHIDVRHRKRLVETATSLDSGTISAQIASAMGVPVPNTSNKQVSNQGSAALPFRYVSELQESGLTRGSASDDELQKKYFPPSEHFTSAPRCLTCGKTDHLTSQCRPISCNWCGESDEHFPWACPKIVSCERCREQGHRAKNCHMKLNRAKDERVICDLCKVKGHVETECSKLWRSYEPPDLVRQVQSLLVNCFACGSSAHFGGDCGMRRKNRALQSLSFLQAEAERYIDPDSENRSFSAGKDYSIQANTKKERRDFSIKGRAKNDPIDLDSASDTGDFIGPPAKRAKPAQGLIQIAKNAGIRKGSNPPPISQVFSRAPDSYQPQYGRRERSPPAYRDFRDRDNLDHAYDRPNGPYRDDYDSYGAGPDHYEPQARYFNGHESGDRYDGRPLANTDGEIVLGDNGALAGVDASRGNHNAPRSRNASSSRGGGNASSRGSQAPTSRPKRQTRRTKAKRRGRGS